MEPNTSLYQSRTARRLSSLIAGLLLCFAAGALAADPTLTQINPLGATLEDTQKVIDYNELANAANEADADPATTIRFRVEAVSSGTLRKGGANVNPGNTTLGPGETLEWTPPGNQNGQINAFTVKAYDGSNASTTAIAVPIPVTPVNDAPSFTKGANITQNEDSGAFSDAGWATAISEGPSENQSLTFTVTTPATTLFSTPPQVDASGRLTFTAAPNQNGSVTATIFLKDNGGTANSGTDQSPSQTFTITLTPQPDSPQISGAISSAISDSMTEAAPETSLFNLTANPVTVTDADAGQPNAGVAGSFTVDATVTIPNTAEDLGTFSFPGSTKSTSGNDIIYTYPGASPSALTTQLRTARFIPTPNRVAVGSTSGFTVRLRVTDDPSNPPAAQLNGNVTVTSVDDAPVVGLTLVPSTISDSQEVTPFRVTVSDPDLLDDTVETFSLTLTETSAGFGTITLPPGGLNGTAQQVILAMQSVRYRPNSVAGSAIATFSCTAVAHHPRGDKTSAPATANLTITGLNDPPDIAGINTELIRTDDNPATPAVLPFQSVTIIDPDAGQTLTVSVNLDDPAKGSILSPPVTGTAAQVTQLLHGLQFKPTPNRVAVGQTETTTLTLSVSDGALSKTNNQTRIATLSVNGAPVIAGVPDAANQPKAVSQSPPVKPFAGISVSDDDVSPQVTVLVRLDNPAKGVLTGAGFAEQPSGSGIYRFDGLDSAATTAIAGLEFIVNPSFSFPPNQPGFTTFTIEVTDALQNRSTRTLSIVLQNIARNFLVTLREDDSRKRAGSLRHAIENARDNDVITFAFADYPAILRLDPTLGPLVLKRHLRLKGPGADLLTISGDRDGNGQGEMQLFAIEASVAMEGLTLSQGFASTGGAVHVGRDPANPGNAAGSLTLSYCAVTDSRASQWGGAIDVEEGSLFLDHCLVKNNATDPSFGLGGGAISLYTSAACSFTATTFSGNRQRSATGFGGGAIYAENFNPQAIFAVAVNQCTFSENEDTAQKGTSIHSNVFNTRVTARGTIFADAAQRNLQVAGGGQILTLGRNISNDAARTTLIQGGQPQSVVLLNHATDKVSTDPLLLPLGTGIGATESYGLSPLSPAIGTIIATAAEGTDGRGVIRDNKPDSGAVEFSARERVIINEVQTDPAPGGFAFVEFFIPRDSGPVNLSEFELWVDGKLRHTFAANTVPVQPGFGIIVAEGAFAPANANTPVIVSGQPFWEASATDHQRSTFELRTKGPNGISVAKAGLVNVFANPSNPVLNLSFPNNSLSLAPQFRGTAYVPNSTGQAPPLGPDLAHGGAASSPGADTGGTPFGLDNAFPFAAADTFTVNEDDLTSLNVLTNDSDSDGLDKLVMVDVSTTRSAAVGNDPVGNDATASSALASIVSLAPGTAPLRGTALWYDPRISMNHLPVGVSAVDNFFYTIVDVGSGPVNAYGASGPATVVTSPAHRLTNGEQITISGSSTAAYNGTFSITRISADTFTIPVSFTDDPATKGAWTTVGTRLTTKRSENQAVITVMGRNDAPAPAPDTLTTNEETILRIMGDPDLIASAPVFDTDPSYPLPRAFASTSLLANDTDPDDDDNTFKKLRIVGVGQAKAVAQYLGTAGQSPVTVKAPSHGLSSGASVLVSGYGGHASYNGYHIVTVVDADTFTIPIAFVEDHQQRGLFGVLTSEGRLQTTSAMGAAVSLEIRTSRLETNIIYNPRTSTALNSLSKNEPGVDSFYYVVEDSHGANAFAKVTINVTGVNDTPVPLADPLSTGNLSSLATGGMTLRDVLAAAKVQYSVPSSGGSGTVTLTAGDPPATFVLTDVLRTDEDTALTIATSSLLSNDSDVDHLDTLTISLGAGQNVSREGASIQLAPGGLSLFYNPAASTRLNALAREEKIIDTFVVTVNDGTASVPSIVAVEVSGRNDKPTALPDHSTIPEDQFLTLAAPGVLLNDREPDQDTRLPDNRKVIIPVANAGTTVFGTSVNTTVTPAEGSITSFQAITGSPGLTQVNAPAHGLQTGEEVVITGSQAAALNGQFPVTRIDANAFSIPVPSSAGAAPAGAASWSSLRSALTYDPRGSVFTPGGPAFTLDGLAQGQTYADTFIYTVFDGSLIFANDDSFRVAADSSDVILPVSANDVNLSGLTGGLTVVSVGTPSQRGTAAIGSNNTIVYSPETSFVGDEFFTYTVMDANGNVDSALVTVRATVEQLNGNLQANADAFSVAKGQSPLLQVLANDDIVPATGAVLAITGIATAPSAGGTAVIEGSGIRYTPAASAPVYPYTETFVYRISAGGTAAATATVTIQVIDREGTLNLRADAVSVQSGSNNNLLEVLANDNILPGSGLSLTIIAAGTPVPGTQSHGTVQITPDGKRLNYSPNPDFVGTDRFTYTASDGLGGTGTNSVSVTVGGLTTANDFFTVSSASATPNTLDVLANDRVLGSAGAISIKSVAPLADPLGTMAVSADRQTLSFTPNVGQSGEKTFIYRVEDGTGREADGSVTLFVSGPGLRANSDFFAVQADSVSTALDVLLNDAVIPDNGQQKAIVSIGTGSNAPDHGGTVVINATNDRILYTPVNGFTGEEKFTYVVSDGDNTNTAQVVVKVSSGAIFAGDDSFSVYKGISSIRLDVLSNDRVLPPGGQQLTITGVGIIQNAPGQQGAVVITDDGGGLLYTPNPANSVYPYTESFTYEISDGTVRRAEGTVRVEVLDRAGAREMETNDDAFTVLADSQNIILAVLANDDIRPASAADWTITAISTPNHGGVAVVSGPAITYTPAAGFVGTETFTYTVSDGLGGTGNGTVTVKAGDVRISDDTFTVLSGSGFTPLDVLANDGVFPAGFPDRENLPDLTGFTLSAAPMTPDHGGTATVSGDSISYHPFPGFAGVESFTYWVKDDSGTLFPGRVTVNVELSGSDRSSAPLTITVTGVNDPPVFVNPQVTATNDRTAVNPFANATILEVDNQGAQKVTVTITYPADRGILSGGFTIISPGVAQFVGAAAEATAALRGLRFTPAENRIPVGQTEDTVFGVTLNDGFVTSPVAVNGIRTTVTPVNDRPVLTGTLAGQKLYQRSTLRPFVGVNITDPDNLTLQTLAVTVKIDTPVKGILTNTGGFVQTPAGSGIYTFSGTASAAATALRAMLFQPTPGGRVTPSQPETSTFTITVDDGASAPVVDAATTIIVLHGEVDRKLPLTSGGADASQPSADFGWDVALSGNTLVVGSPRRDSPLSDAGQVNVYERNAGLGAPWGQVAVLVPPDLKATERFGETVAIDGDVIVVGAPHADPAGFPNLSGAAYIYRRDPADPNAWTLLKKLLPPTTNGNGGDQFGTGVAVQGSTVIVTSPHSNRGGDTDVGRVQVFEQNNGGPDNWGLGQTLFSDDGSNGDSFGNSVAISGNTIVVGAHEVDRTQSDAGRIMGAAYVFTRPAPGGIWTQTRKLEAFGDPEARANDRFGSDVDIDGDTIIVGALGFDPVVGGTRRDDAGAAFIYERNLGGDGQWGLVTKLASSDAAAVEAFGDSVAIAGDLILVGAPKNPAGTRPGFADLYRRDQSGPGGWGPIDRFSPGAANSSDGFGSGVALDGFTGAIGSLADNGAGSTRVYQFQYDLGPRQAIFIADQLAVENQPFTFAIPAGAFGDPIYDSLTFQASLSSGAPLPAAGWLSFNPATAAFNGTPVPANNAVYKVVVRASNPLGTAVLSNEFTIDVKLDPARSLRRAYDAWSVTKFPAATLAVPGLEATVWGPLANPDADSAANLLEMLFGTVPQSFGLTPVTVAKSGSGIALTFPRSPDMPMEFIHVEWSEGLGAWSRANVGYTSQITGGVEFITATVYPDAPRKAVFGRIAIGP